MNIKTWQDRRGRGSDAKVGIPEVDAEVLELRAALARHCAAPVAEAQPVGLLKAARRYLAAVNESSALEMEWSTAAAHTEYDRARWELQKALAAPTPPAPQEVEQARDAARYRLVRTFSPRAFTDLWELNIAGKGAFDDLVDAAMSAQPDDSGSQ